MILFVKVLTMGFEFYLGVMNCKENFQVNVGLIDHGIVTTHEIHLEVLII